ncbi:MAG TPA: arylamine N-acetyltransferase [Anaerolineales bacterium]|jgi:N-hydroxyarylamine O-acetyltransferase|nr:arylamine N-acetyltransferase [Anaerolineales bacterium]
MNLPDYLTRIGYAGAIKPDAQTLRGLQRAHMLSVPFENLNIGLKRPILLNEEALWEKIVVQKRGGFCYELNGLFAWLLKELGFEVTYLNARVYNHQGQLGIDFDHLALLVQVLGSRERWLADVGFGDSFQEPLNFEERGEQLQGLRAYRLEEAQNGFVTWQKNYDGIWERQYFFDLQPRRFPMEYESACVYHQTSPQSSFTRGSIISRATAEGRVSLEDRRLILTENGQRSETPILDTTEYNKLLQQYFDVTLSEEHFHHDN